MRATLSAIAVFLAIAIGANSQDTNAQHKISATEAAKHYTETLIVTGKVANVTIRPKVVYLNIEKPFPDSPFIGVIFARDTNKFSDLPSLKGKDIEIKGTVKEYRGKPEIILENTNQLTVVEKSNEAGQK